MPRQPAPAVKQVSTGPSGMLIGGVAALLIAVVGVVIWLVVRGGGSLEAEGSSGTLPEGGGVVISDVAGVPEVKLYEDFQCPWCALLEESIGEDLTEKAQAGQISLTVTTMSGLEGRLGNDSSSRAANAALCADDAGDFAAYRAEVFAHQPEEGIGYTDEELVQFATGAGLDGSELATFTSCATGGTYRDYVADMQERANRDDVTATPTVVINGDALAQDELGQLLDDPASLDAIIEAHA